MTLGKKGRKGKKPKSDLRAVNFGDDLKIRGRLDQVKSHSKQPWGIKYKRDNEE
jgi:hypothetical protein